MSLRNYILKETEIHRGKTVNYLGIDIESYIVKEAIRRLQTLSTTVEINNLGMYREDRDWTKLHIKTTFTEEQLDDWFYKTKFSDHFEANVYVIKPEVF